MPRSYSFQDIKTLVERTAPIWYLHDEEEYLPSSVDWFLRQATLVSRDGTRTVLGTTAPEDNLPQQATWPVPGDFDHAEQWLEVPESAYAGDLDSARSYVTIRRVEPGFLDISHWFWYPANGCGTARLSTLAFDTVMVTQERVALTTLGFHVSDWEKITIRVNESTNAVDSVYFAQHGGGHWYRPGESGLLTAGTRILVMASRNGHASYSIEGEHYSAHLKTAPPGVWAKLTPSAIEFWLRNDARMGRRQIDCAQRHEIVHIQSGPDGVTLTGELPTGSGAPFYGRGAQADGNLFLREPKWLNYPYRWGPETEQKISHELVFKALSALTPQLMVVGAATGGLELPLLGAAAGLRPGLREDGDGERQAGPQGQVHRRRRGRPGAAARAGQSVPRGGDRQCGGHGRLGRGRRARRRGLEHGAGQ